jgi:hypothetical protein
MALVDGQVVAGMKRTLTARAATFEIRTLRRLAPDEEDAIQDAAARCARYLELELRLVWQEPPSVGRA